MHPNILNSVMDDKMWYHISVIMDMIDSSISNNVELNFSWTQAPAPSGHAALVAELHFDKLHIYR